ncbi:MAG TPA: hypothetical protein VED40_16690 [Azospirillaceae bacterium]|nr:hypothetical protein [Azospirillaceae bacterium]
MRTAVREVGRMAMAGLLALAALFVLAGPAAAHQGHVHAAQAAHGAPVSAARLHAVPAPARQVQAPTAASPELMLRDAVQAADIRTDCHALAAAAVLTAGGAGDCPGHGGHEPGGECCCGPAHCAGIGAAGLPLSPAALPSPAAAEPRPGLASAVPPGIGHAPDLRPPLAAA